MLRPTSLQAQASANVTHSLAHSKYLERHQTFSCKGLLIFTGNPASLMSFPTHLQAQASANDLFPLEHSKYLGRYQI